MPAKISLSIPDEQPIHLELTAHNISMECLVVLSLDEAKELRQALDLAVILMMRHEHS